MVNKKGHINIEWKASSHHGAPAASSTEDDDAKHSTAQDVGSPAVKS